MSMELVRKLRIILPVAALVCCLLGRIFQSIPVVMFIFEMIAMALLIADVVISILFWRCPACGGWLPQRRFSIDYCPKCGCPLD